MLLFLNISSKTYIIIDDLPGYLLEHLKSHHGLLAVFVGGVLDKLNDIPGTYFLISAHDYVIPVDFVQLCEVLSSATQTDDNNGDILSAVFIHCVHKLGNIVVDVVGDQEKDVIFVLLFGFAGFGLQLASLHLLKDVLQDGIE